MFTVKIYDFSDTLLHEIPQDEIISVDMSEREVESEVSLMRTPQRCTITAVSSSWLLENIVEMPAHVVAYRNIAKYKVLVWFDGKKVGEYLIINDQQSTVLDGVSVSFICYDYTILIELYKDLEINNINMGNLWGISSGGGYGGVLSNALTQISLSLGFAPNMTETPSTFRIPAVGERIATLNLREQMQEADTLGHKLAEREGRTHYNYMGFTANVGFATNKTDNLHISRNVPFASVILEYEEVYDENAIWKPVGGWTVRPKYRISMSVQYWQLYNITGLRKIHEESLSTGFFFTKNDKTVEGGVVRRPTFEELKAKELGFEGDNETLTEGWKVFAYNYGAYASWLTGQTSTLPSPHIPKFPQLAKNTPSLQSPYYGSYSWQGGNYLNPTLTALESVTIRRTGVVNPHYVTFDKPTINFFDALTDLLYIRRQSLYADENGAVRVVPVDTEPSLSPTAITNDSIEYRSKLLYGRGELSKKTISITADNYDYLEGKLWSAYKSARNRRELSLTLLNTTAPIVMSDYFIDSKFQGYAKSVSSDYLSNRHEVVLSIYDTASIKFLVTDGVAGVPQALISLKLDSLNRGGLTDNNGEVSFANVPMSNTPISYTISKEGYTQITDTITVATATLHTVTKQLSLPIPKNPNVIPRSLQGRTEIDISSEDNSEIRYTTDGTTPDRDSPLFEGVFMITENKTIKVRAFNDDNQSSVVVKSAEVEALEIEEEDVDFTVKGSELRVAPRTVAGTQIRYTTDGSEPNITSPILDALTSFDNVINPTLFKTRRFVDGVPVTPTVNNYVKSEPIIITGEVVLASETNKIDIIPVMRQGFVEATITARSQIEHRQDGIGVSIAPFHIYLATVQTFKIVAFKTVGANELFQVYGSEQGVMLGGVAKYADGAGIPTELINQNVIIAGDNHPYWNATFEGYPGWGIIPEVVFPNSGAGTLLDGVTNAILKYELKIELNTVIGGRNWL